MTEMMTIGLGHRLISTHPDFGCGEFDEGEVVGVVLFEAGGDGSEVFDLIEKPLDEVAVAIKERAERRGIHPVRHRLDVGPGSLRLQIGTQRIAVVGAVGEEDLAGAEIAQHVGGTAPVMGLTGGQFERDRQPVGIDQHMDLGRQSAARAPHASGRSIVPFRGLRAPLLTLAAC